MSETKGKAMHYTVVEDDYGLCIREDKIAAVGRNTDGHVFIESVGGARYYVSDETAERARRVLRYGGFA